MDRNQAIIYLQITAKTKPTPCQACPRYRPLGADESEIFKPPSRERWIYMLTGMILTLLGVFALMRFWRSVLMILLGAVAFLMALGLEAVAEWIMHR